MRCFPAIAVVVSSLLANAASAQPPFPLPPFLESNKASSDGDGETASETPSISELSERMRQSAEIVRLDLLEKLDEIDGTLNEKLSVLKDSLESDSASVRMVVLDKVRQSRLVDDDVIAEIDAIIESGDNPLEQIIAVRASWAAGATDTNVDLLTQALASTDPALANEAANALSEGGVSSQAALLSALDSNSTQVRALAAEALGDFDRGGSVSQKLVALLVDDAAEVRASAASALSGGQSLDPSAIQSLIAMLGDDPDASVRARAAGTLASLSDTHPQIAGPLMEEITSSDPATAKSLVRSIAGHGGSGAAGVLAAALGTAQAEVAAEIVNQLTGMGSTGLRALVGSLDDEASRYWAAVGIADFGTEARPVADELAGLVAESTPDVQLELLLTLASIGADSTKSAAVIIEQLSAEQIANRYAATFAVVRLDLGGEPIEAALTSNATSNDPTLKVLSQFALAKLHPRDPRYGIRALKELARAAASGAPNLRKVAAAALSELKP